MDPKFLQELGKTRIVLSTIKYPPFSQHLQVRIKRETKDLPVVIDVQFDAFPKTFVHTEKTSYPTWHTLQKDPVK
jgi:hypothetical protein